MTIEVIELTKHFSKVAVQNVSFKLTKGAPLALLGRNGAGKSTIIKLILGLLKPTFGTILKEKGLTVGYLPEERGVYQDVTVEEHLKFFAKLSNVRSIGNAVEYWLNRLELSPYRKFKLKYLSKGNAQKVQLAITLIHDPDLIVLDEPFSGLDPVSMDLFYRVIKEESENKYMIISSHQMNRVENISKQIIFLNKGEVIAQGDIDSLKGRYGEKRIRLPNTPNLKELLRNYEKHVTKTEIIIKADTNDIYNDIIQKIHNSQTEVAFVYYESLPLEELFVQILGGES